jgi:hypothetical protein
MRTVDSTVEELISALSTGELRVRPTSVLAIYPPRLPAVQSFAYGIAGDVPVVGDWDGDGYAGIGVRRGNVWLLRNAVNTGFADEEFPFGLTTDVPVVGDWNGDGIDSVGVYRDGEWFLRNANSAGAPDITFTFGGPDTIPVVGDWNGDGIDGVGYYDPATGEWNLRNALSTGAADITFTFGGTAGDVPVVGDWDGDGVVGIGVWNAGLWSLRQTASGGSIERLYQLGTASDTPVTGDWIGSGTGVAVYSVSSFSIQRSVGAPLLFAANPVWRVRSGVPYVDTRYQARLETVSSLRIGFSSADRVSITLDNAPTNSRELRLTANELTGARAVIGVLLQEYQSVNGQDVICLVRRYDRFNGVVLSVSRDVNLVKIDVVGDAYARLIGATRTKTRRCPLVFKSDECGYTGSETVCSKEYADPVQGCEAYDNKHRFQGITQADRDALTTASGGGFGGPPSGGGGTGGGGGFGGGGYGRGGGFGDQFQENYLY